MKNYEGEAMRHAGDALAAQIEEDPIASSHVQMNLGLFYRICEFAGRGSFIIGKKGAYSEAKNNGDF